MFFVVEPGALARAFSNKSSLVTGNIPFNVGLNLIDPHISYNCTTLREVNELPRAVGHKRVILMVLGQLPFSGPDNGESGTVRGRFDAVPGGE
jgi:hypothetical protein